MSPIDRTPSYAWFLLILYLFLPRMCILSCGKQYFLMDNIICSAIYFFNRSEKDITDFDYDWSLDCFKRIISPSNQLSYMFPQQKIFFFFFQGFFFWFRLSAALISNHFPISSWIASLLYSLHHILTYKLLSFQK